jgi:hypothetical protein
MLRIFRVAGILFFALLIGFSANNLWKMHESGELFEKYNSNRKTNITILASSIVMVGIFGAFELTRTRRMTERRGFGEAHYSEEEPVEDEVQDIANIYASPETQDVWNRRRRSSHRPSHKQNVELANIWMGLLRFCCVIIPAYYVFKLTMLFRLGFSGQPDEWVSLAGFGVISVCSFIMALGIGLKRMWGYTWGYLVAIMNLVVFPIGTGFGLFMLVGLVGAAPLFIVPEKKRQRKARRAARRKANAKAREEAASS